jgi:hypothetical protein
MRGRNTSIDKELLYPHIYWLVVKVIVVTVILDQLMLQIEASNG